MRGNYSITSAGLQGASGLNFFLLLLIKGVGGYYYYVRWKLKINRHIFEAILIIYYFNYQDNLVLNLILWYLIKVSKIFSRLIFAYSGEVGT